MVGSAAAFGAAGAKSLSACGSALGRCEVFLSKGPVLSLASGGLLHGFLCFHYAMPASTRLRRTLHYLGRLSWVLFMTQHPIAQIRELLLTRAFFCGLSLAPIRDHLAIDPFFLQLAAAVVIEKVESRFFTLLG